MNKSKKEYDFLVIIPGQAAVGVKAHSAFAAFNIVTDALIRKGKMKKKVPFKYCEVRTTQRIEVEAKTGTRIHTLEFTDNRL